MTDQPAIINIILTDENINGSAIREAIARGVSIIRDVDIDVSCQKGRKYDDCLFDYAVANGYVLITNNIKDFAGNYAKAESHPGVVFVHDATNRNPHDLAEWLVAISTEPMLNETMWI